MSQHWEKLYLQQQQQQQQQRCVKYWNRITIDQAVFQPFLFAGAYL